jgi:hypothetical protein
VLKVVEVPQDWRIAVDAALAVVPEPMPEHCERVARLLGPVQHRENGETS